MAEEIKVGRLGIFPEVSRPVFGISAVIIIGFIVFGAVFTETANALFTGAQDAITRYFGWLFILLMNVVLVACVYLAVGPYGQIRLGEQTEAPQYGLISWVSMLFSAGIGIGLLYWAVAEPLFHFASPPIGEAETIDSAQQAMVISFLHWGLHGWAIYVLVGLSLAYFSFRKGLPLAIRSSLYPLIGDRIYGPIGHAVDIFAVFGTMFGVVTSLGLGAMQVNSGLNYLFGVPDSVWVQLVIIAGITGLAVISVMVGLDKGIRRISVFNIWLSIALLAFILVLGPTLFILKSYVENIGNYLQGLLELSFWSEAYLDSNWQGSWTIFYWAWWIAWSPFVGTFIARVSRGRTISQFVAGVLLIPAGMIFFWFTALGGTSLYLEMNGEPGLVAATMENYGMAIFKLLELMPLTTVISAIVIVMIIVWFVTSSDSGSFVIDMLTAGGHLDPPRIQRAFWATTEGAVAAILLVAGGLGALQAAAVVAGFPFALVVCFMLYALFRGLRRDRLMVYRAQQMFRTEEEAHAHIKGEGQEAKDD